jgi:hypothetical protein
MTQRNEPSPAHTTHPTPDATDPPAPSSAFSKPLIMQTAPADHPCAANARNSASPRRHNLDHTTPRGGLALIEVMAAQDFNRHFSSWCGHSPATAETTLTTCYR